MPEYYPVDSTPIEVELPDKIDLNSLARQKTGGYTPTAVRHPFHRIQPLPPMSYDIVHEMLRTPAIRIAADLRRSVLMKPRFEIRGDMKIARFVRHAFEQLWEYAVPHLIEALWYTKAAVELVAGRDRKGHISIVGARSFAPQDVHPLRSSETRNFAGFRVYNVKNASETEIREHEGRTYRDIMWPKSLGVYYLHQHQDGSYVGASELEPAFGPWFEMYSDGGAVNNRRMFFFKNAGNGGRMYHPVGGERDENGNFISNADYARQILEWTRSGHTLAIPNTRDENGNDEWRYEDPTVTQGGEHFIDYVRELEDRCMLGAGVPREVVESAESGSFAGRSLIVQTWLDCHTGILKRLFRVLDEQAVRRLVRLNYGPDAVNSYSIHGVEVDSDRFMPVPPANVPAAVPGGGELAEGERPGGNGEPVQMSAAEPRVVEEHRIVVAVEDAAPQDGKLLFEEPTLAAV